MYFGLRATHIVSLGILIEFIFYKNNIHRITGLLTN